MSDSDGKHMASPSVLCPTCPVGPCLRNWQLLAGVAVSLSASPFVRACVARSPCVVTLRCLCAPTVTSITPISQGPSPPASSTSPLSGACKHPFNYLPLQYCSVELQHCGYTLVVCNQSTRVRRLTHRTPAVRYSTARHEQYSTPGLSVSRVDPAPSTINPDARAHHDHHF